MQACSKIKIKILDGVKVSIIKEPKLLFEKTQLNDSIKICIVLLFNMYLYKDLFLCIFF